MEEIFNRRSIRKFTGAPIDEGDLKKILRAGFQAPSAHNKEPRDFILIRDKSILEEILQVHKYGKMLVEAGTAILVCGNLEEQEKLGYLLADCSASIQNILTMIEHLGLGGVWCGIHPIEKLEEDIRSIVNLPDHIVPVGIIALGHKDEDKGAIDRYNPDRIHYDKW